MSKIEIVPIKNIPNEIDIIVNESTRDGFSLVKRFKENWENGKNRFDKNGELYLGAWVDGRLVGVGGVNIDPYMSDESIGRLRHLYVLKEYRRHGVAKKIVHTLLDHSKSYFKKVRLRSNDKDETGNSFYAALKFEVVDDDESASHIYNL